MLLPGCLESHCLQFPFTATFLRVTRTLRRLSFKHHLHMFLHLKGFISYWCAFIARRGSGLRKKNSIENMRYQLKYTLECTLHVMPLHFNSNP